ncbi:MAG: RNA polymerase II mediator complex subunit [Phylliscum demangeonii]|nr:MAG: RNA polymerase II mediator complex subunit [Phylliscum demangeonii]
MEVTATNSERPSSLALPLRVWPTEDPILDSLPSLVRRINEQKGHFRNVTEQSVDDEIRDANADAETHGSKTREEDDDEDDVEPVEDEEDASVRKEALRAAKEEILKQIGTAYIETYYALDFVSLLLSKETPRQAELSMSQHLKQHVPLGSLGAEKTQPASRRTESIKEKESVLMGWRIEGLNAAANRLLKSAKRLAREMDQETHYWEQILDIDRQGWALCRLPREKHTLGVRFGFLEAAADYRERGLAALRRGDNGNVVLDQGLFNAKPKALRVRMEDASGNVISTSTVPRNARPDAPVEELILQARNSIYEEELYHELSREARTLTNQGVRTTESAIVLALPDQRRVVVDMVPLDATGHTAITSSVGPEGAEGSKEVSAVAEGIGLALRLLLSHAHRQNHRRRAQLPPPMTDRKRPIPPYSMIRPILTQLFHRAAVDALRPWLHSLCRLMHRAGLPAQVTLVAAASLSSTAPPAPFPSSEADADADAGKTKTTTKRSTTTGRTAPETVIDALSASVETIVHLALPARTHVRLRLRTLVAPPAPGTEYIVTTTTTTTTTTHEDQPPRSPNSPSALSIQPNKGHHPPARMRFDSPPELKRYLLHLSTLALVHEIAHAPPPPRPLMPTMPPPTHAGSLPSTSWIQGSVFNELIQDYPGTARTKRLQVTVAEDGLEVRWGWMNGRAGSSHQHQQHQQHQQRRVAWNVPVNDGGREDGDDGGAPVTTRTFRQVVEEAGRYSS